MEKFGFSLYVDVLSNIIFFYIYIFICIFLFLFFFVFLCFCVLCMIFMLVQFFSYCLYFIYR